MVSSPEYKRYIFRENAHKVITEGFWVYIRCFPIPERQCHDFYASKDTTYKYSSLYTGTTKLCTLDDWTTANSNDHYGCDDLDGLLPDVPLFIMIMDTVISFIIHLIIGIHIVSPIHTVYDLNLTNLLIFIHNLFVVLTHVLSYYSKYNTLSTVVMFIMIPINMFIVISNCIVIVEHLDEIEDIKNDWENRIRNPTTTRPIHNVRQRVMPTPPPSPITPTTPTITGETICVICMEHRRNIILMPCNHICICSYCGINIPECPVCRTPVNSQMNVYIA
jgi:hypothetical protein